MSYPHVLSISVNSVGYKEGRDNGNGQNNSSFQAPPQTRQTLATPDRSLFSHFPFILKPVSLMPSRTFFLLRLKFLRYVCVSYVLPCYIFFFFPLNNCQLTAPLAIRVISLNAVDFLATKTSSLYFSELQAVVPVTFVL